MTVDELLQELQTLDRSDDVPIHLAVAATGWDASYLLAALETLDGVGELFGRDLGPEVEHVVMSLREAV